MWYAQKFATWTLTKLVTSYWAQVSKDERVQLRNYVLNYLATKGPQLHLDVNRELSTLLCRVTKLGWIEDEVHRNIVDDLSSFLEASPEHCVIGLQVLVRLVSEMNNTATTMRQRRSLTHSQNRKVALSFRELVLQKTFKIALSTLSKLSAAPGHPRLRQYGIELALGCLSFDFVGGSLDESSEDLGTIHVPIGWHSVIEDGNTSKLFLDLYSSLCSVDTSQSSKCLECMVQLASMRRTLFATDQLRMQNIRRHIEATVKILRTRAGLEDHNNYHQFCRWLARLKVNYQLDELISLNAYREWVDLVASFTMQSLSVDWSWIGDSLFYLLSLWSRLIAAKPYLKGGKDAHLDEYVAKIVQQYVTRRLYALSQISDDDDEEDFSEHLDSIPVIFRLQYDKSSTFLFSVMDPLLENYKRIASTGIQNENTADVSRLERELAWLTRIIAAVVSGRLNSSGSEANELIDGDLSARVFQLMILTADTDNAARSRPGATPKFLATPAGRARFTKGALALDDAIVDFTQSFRKSYIGEEAVATSKVYVRMAERLGMTNHMVVLNVVATKIACNLRNYGVVDGLQIIGKSLSLLSDLACGYSSSRLLCKLNTICEMIAHHDEEHFPFMCGPDAKTGRHRTTFYNVLLRILYASGGVDFNLEREFLRFMEPLRIKLEALWAIQTKEAVLADPSVKAAFIGVCRDLRGVVSTMTSRKSYNLFFEWLYPKHTPVLLKMCEVFSEAGEPAATNPLLKFFCEFIFNRSQRIVFDCSSPNGILMFRETSKILVTYGTHTLANWGRMGGLHSAVKSGGVDVYRSLYKGIWVCLTMFHRSLAGNYVNFGVFSLYGDPALSDAMGITFRMLMAPPLEEVMAYPKLARAYFSLLESLCQHHANEIAKLEHQMFVRIMQALTEGLQSHEVWMSSSSASSIDHLTAYRFKQTLKDTEYGRMMKAHVEQSPELFPTCLEVVFNTMLHVDCTNQWSLSRPLLGLILTNEEAFLRIKANTVHAQQTPERQGLVETAFAKLMKDIQPTLESKNRDKFTHQVTQFRISLRSI